jgi:E3 ubiquitin-protein ligase CCNP1IP1
MEHTLHCNVLKCRKELSDQAAVTTCRYVLKPFQHDNGMTSYSHVFCGDCAEQCQLVRQVQGQRRVCPACEMHLANADDVAVTNLNPTEDYKTSILSGLSPSIIMECAGRALSFWAYQTAQEMFVMFPSFWLVLNHTSVYQDYLSRSLTEKYAALNVQIDKIINDANAEISSLRNKMSSKNYMPRISIEFSNCTTRHAG